MAARRTAGSQGCPLPAPRWSRSNRFSTSELLGYGLDLLVPIKDAVTADGDTGDNAADFELVEFKMTV